MPARRPRRGRRGGSPGRAALPLLWVGAAAALLAAFVALACLATFAPGLAAWDARIAEAVAARRDAAWSRAFWVFTLLGDDPLMAVLSAALVCLLFVWGRRAQAAAAAAGLAVAWLVTHVSKAAAGRGRPPHDAALIEMPGSHSMPSGHALMSVVFFGLLVYACLARREGRPSSRFDGAGHASWAAAAVVSVGAGLAALVGWSRVYLGVHWPSDVIAGWCAGGAVLVVTLGLTRRWRRARGPRGLFRAAEPWRSPAARAAAVATAIAVVCAVAAVTALIDPLF